jgi:hypothetical protein
MGGGASLAVAGNDRPARQGARDQSAKIIEDGPMNAMGKTDEEIRAEIEANRKLIERLVDTRGRQRQHAAVYNAFTKRINAAKAMIRRAEKRLNK